MKHLWSPWRMKYIQSNGNNKAEGCIFCNAVAREDSPENLITWRGERSFVILNLFPYTSGHLMIVPYQHAATLEELDAGTRADMMELTSRAMGVLRKIYQPQAFNMGANIGEAAGAGVPGHVHIHVVPRWSGDTNFMSTLGETRVLPETLEETYERVRKGFHGVK